MRRGFGAGRLVLGVNLPGGGGGLWYVGGVEGTWRKLRATEAVRQDARQVGLLMTVAGVIGIFLEPSGMLVESIGLAVTGLIVWSAVVRFS